MSSWKVDDKKVNVERFSIESNPILALNMRCPRVELFY